MSLFTYPGLDIIDHRQILRAATPHPDWKIGRRPGKPTHVTWHYNGPKVDDRSERGELSMLIVDAREHIRPRAEGGRIGGDGIMYHFIIHANGKIRQVRDIEDQLWHCANQDGNTWSISLHCPLGGDQVMTDPQAQSLFNLTEALIAAYGMDGRTHVKGHREWLGASTLCPGPQMTRKLIAWRSGVASVAEIDRAPGVFFVHVDTANIRTGPGTEAYRSSFRVVRSVSKGFQFECDTVTLGEQVDGDPRWMHLKNGEGFISAALLNRVVEIPVVTPVPMPPAPAPTDQQPIPAPVNPPPPVILPAIVSGQTIIGSVHVPFPVLKQDLDVVAPHISEDDRVMIAGAYIAFGVLSGIGSLIPYAQARHETGNFASERWLKSYNPAGLGATNDGAWGGHFASISHGIAAQFGHLLGYAAVNSKLSVEQQALTLCSPRIGLLNSGTKRGVAPRWIDLNGRWAVPGTEYADRILAIANRIYTTYVT